MTRPTVHPQFRAQTEAAVREGPPADPERDAILAALERWIAQRPGLEWQNYSTSDYAASRAAYMADKRAIERQGRDARQLLQAIRWRHSIGSAQLRYALENSFAGRLTWNGTTLDYVTGQYWPMEYRAAACAVLAGALWQYFRDTKPAGITNVSDWIKAKAHADLGRGIANRWFH